MDLSVRKFITKKKEPKLTKKQSSGFFKLLAELLMNGFSLNESFSFMRKAKVLPAALIDFLIDGLESGEELTESLVKLEVSSEIITQIEFAQRHGNLAATLTGIEQHMGIMQKQRENLSKILIYPFILLLFLFAALIGMRQFLLPQLQMSGLTTTDNFGIQFVRASPYVLGGGMLLLISLTISVRLLLKRKTPFNRAVFLAKIPGFRSYYIQYTSAFFSLEWGKLFSQGMEIKHIVVTMKGLLNESLMRELSEIIERGLLKGEPFYNQLEYFPFFSEELALIIQQGEVKGNLGKELMIYSEICWRSFFLRIEKLIQWLQPIIFLIIALAVVGIYAAMLLPIYGGIDTL
ncbi:competence type IV pilus assembly protein ComGB [Enterococcus sp. LJL51]|uniref:competence type IV pilus assembly protein ComGB n=1 Tax=Enterococcus sp. LJL51 TaxID=3416656 RepID=UPI003CF0E914